MSYHQSSAINEWTLIMNVQKWMKENECSMLKNVQEDVQKWMKMNEPSKCLWMNVKLNVLYRKTSDGLWWKENW